MLFARTKVVKQNFAGPVLENGDHMLMQQDVTGKPTVKFKLFDFDLFQKKYLIRYDDMSKSKERSKAATALSRYLFYNNR